MILLPRGNPVKERIDPGKVHLPDALRKLQRGRFSGYLRFDAADGGTGILVFAGGRLSSALFEGEGERPVGVDALARIFAASLGGGALLDIYTLSPELAQSVDALLHGDVLFQGQELKLIDIKALLARLREERISGCLRIYTAERIALIFYRDGAPLGFFHDGSTAIETTADTSMSVARLPGAKIDVLTSRQEEGPPADLLAGADLDGLWKTALERVRRIRQAREAEALRGRELQVRDRRLKLLTMLRGVAETHLGRIGTSLVDKALAQSLPDGGRIGATELQTCLETLAGLAKLVAGSSAIDRMLTQMKGAARPFLEPD